MSSMMFREAETAAAAKEPVQRPRRYVSPGVGYTKEPSPKRLGRGLSGML